MGQSKIRLIHHFLENSARRFPGKTALVCKEKRFPYQQIDARADVLAAWLLDLGIRAGDRIIILLDNSPAYVVGYFGILKAGGVTVPLSTGIKTKGLKAIINEIKPRAILSSEKYERLIANAAGSAPGRPIILIHGRRFGKSGSGEQAKYWCGDDLDKGGRVSAFPIEPGSIASIIYTSGSTGQPKGVMLTHGNIVSNVLSICMSLSISQNDIQMVVLPFFYVMGKSLLNTHFAAGGTVVINNSFAFPASVINEMVRERVTGFSGVPSTYAYLLHRSPLERYRASLDSLRYCSQAGGHMSGTIKRELRKILPEHTAIYIMYGATEASARLTCLSPGAFSKKMNSIGKPIPGVQIRIMDAKGREKPPGDIGELVAKGPNIMKGYWENEPATRRALENDSYHTGDLGYQDSEGFLYLTGRKDNMVKTGGHRINPQEIEDAIMDTGMVVEATVFGLKDPLLGMRLASLVVPKNKIYHIRRIAKSCATILPKYKLPRDMLAVAKLPKKANGKVDQRKCRKIYEQMTG